MVACASAVWLYCELVLLLRPQSFFGASSFASVPARPDPVWGKGVWASRVAACAAAVRFPTGAGAFFRWWSGAAGFGGRSSASSRSVGADGGLLVVLACAGRRVPGWRLFAVVERLTAAGGSGSAIPAVVVDLLVVAIAGSVRSGSAVPGDVGDSLRLFFCVVFFVVFFFFFFFFVFFVFFLFVESKGDDLIGLTATE